MASRDRGPRHQGEGFPRDMQAALLSRQTACDRENRTSSEHCEGTQEPGWRRRRAQEAGQAREASPEQAGRAGRGLRERQTLSEARAGASGYSSDRCRELGSRETVAWVCFLKQ